MIEGASQDVQAQAGAERAAVHPPSERRRRRVAWAVLVVAAGILGIAILAGPAIWKPEERAAQVATSTIEVGVPAGEVISQTTPTPTASPTPSATPTAEPMPGPTAAPTSAPTPLATLAPSPTVAPTVAPVPAATPAPTAIVVAVGQPDDSVVSFYRSVAAGDFDAAHALWSHRMKATYPREENLDGRFGDTASISFQQIFVTEQTGRTATVQANFTETYDGGGSREFIGYWRLILVDGRWLLDEPHY